MNALEILTNEEKFLVVDAIDNKKTKALANSVNELLVEMNAQIKKFENFIESEKNGEQGNKIIIAKSLCNFFQGNKHLKVEQAVEGIANEEKAVINEFYNVKNKLLDTIRAVMKESSKEAVISAFDIFSGDFTKCQEGHEVVILKDRNLNILDTLLQELDCQLVINGIFDSIEGQDVDYNLEVLNRNIDLCYRKSNEIYGGKPAKQSKANTLIEKLNEIGQKTVAFYTYKNVLLEIGCNPKGVKDYENELAKQYIPIKKTLQKEFKIELEDICNVVVNEEEYSQFDIEQPIEEQLNSTMEETPSSMETTTPSFDTFASDIQPQINHSFEEPQANFEDHQENYAEEFLNTSTQELNTENPSTNNLFDSFLSNNSDNNDPFNN